MKTKKEKTKKIKIKLPLFVMLPRKTKPPRKVIINMNGYRNWNFILSNQAKHVYKEVLAEQLDGLVLTTPIKLEFLLYKGSKRKSDRSNVLSIQEKFFCDALTEYGCISDDNDEFILETIYSTGGIDKNNPRVEVIITECDLKDITQL